MFLYGSKDKLKELKMYYICSELAYLVHSFWQNNRILPHKVYY